MNKAFWLSQINIKVRQPCQLLEILTLMRKRQQILARDYPVSLVRAGKFSAFNERPLTQKIKWTAIK